jgi:hypothetical protein
MNTRTPLNRPLLGLPWSFVYYVILGFNKGFYLTSKGEQPANSTPSIFGRCKYAIRSCRFIKKHTLIIIKY